MNDAVYQVPFEFTGKLTMKIDRPQLTPADIKRLTADGQPNDRASE